MFYKTPHELKGVHKFLPVLLFNIIATSHDNHLIITCLALSSWFLFAYCTPHMINDCLITQTGMVRIQIQLPFRS